MISKRYQKTTEAMIKQREKYISSSQMRFQKYQPDHIGRQHQPKPAILSDRPLKIIKSTP
jgi:hypothetical protein